MLLVWIPLTIPHPLLTVEEVPADPSRVLPGSQRVPQTLNQRAEMLQGFEDLWTLIQHRHLHALMILFKTQRSDTDRRRFLWNVVQSDPFRRRLWSKLTSFQRAAWESTRSSKAASRASFFCQNNRVSVGNGQWKRRFIQETYLRGQRQKWGDPWTEKQNNEMFLNHSHGCIQTKTSPWTLLSIKIWQN